MELELAEKDQCDSKPTNLSLSHTSEHSPPYKNASKIRNCLSRVQAVLQKIVTNITIEPAAFLFSLAFGIYQTVYPQMTILKACQDRGYNSSVCENLVKPEYDEIQKIVSDDVIIYIYIYI